MNYFVVRTAIWFPDLSKPHHHQNSSHDDVGCQSNEEGDSGEVFPAPDDEDKDEVESNEYEGDGYGDGDEGVGAGVMIDKADFGGNEDLDAKLEKAEEQIKGPAFSLINVDFHDWR